MTCCEYEVALRKESVDRNPIVCTVVDTLELSLSARRAWIEISGPLNAACIWVVALRKESVDRNRAGLLLCLKGRCRSPQGERG